MKDFSIEYAHIYSNSRIEQEHKTSIDILKEIKNANLTNTLSLVVMVDDYSFPDPSFDYQAFLDWLGNHGHKPDLAIRESMLIPLCDEVIKLIQDESIRIEVVDYIKSKKYPCSLFIATWYLLRLGHITSDIFPSELVSRKLLNILPESFMPFEEKGIEIIESTKYKDAARDIGYRYFKGRLIA